MTKREVVLSMLTNATGGVTGREFVDAGVFRYSARIKELRDKGHMIESKRLGQGHYEFRLVGNPSDEAAPRVAEPQQVKDSTEGETKAPSVDPLPLEIPTQPQVFACDLRNSPYWEED
jgi:hypothetical protein